MSAFTGRFLILGNSEKDLGYRRIPIHLSLLPYHLYMALTKQKKVSLVNEFEGLVGGAKSIVFVQFKKLPVSETTELRRALRAENSGYKVTKKTLLKRVLAEKGYTGELPELPGEIAIAFGEDLIAPARGVYAFHKTHKDTVSIVGGVFDGKYMNASEMMTIATIPGRETLIAQFVNLINSPIQRMAVVTQAIADKKASA